MVGHCTAAVTQCCIVDTNRPVVFVYDQPTGTVSLYLAVDSARNGCRAFDFAGPTVWNSLPDELRNSDSFDNFKVHENNSL